MATAQTQPVITGPTGGSSVAFWYLGGIYPGCCSDITNEYWTGWTVNLAANTPDPNPAVYWSTNSPTKIQIVPNGSTGASLIALGHSAPGGGYDITITATVDGVSSAPFPVLISTIWKVTQSAPNPFACNFVGALNGYQATLTNSATDINGVTIIPLDLHESLENTVSKYPSENWGSPVEGNWAAGTWSGNTWIDTVALCWGTGTVVGVPQTVWPWSTSGVTEINTLTQKFWFGSAPPIPHSQNPSTDFQGACPYVQSVNAYTDHVTWTNVITPVPDPVPPNKSACAQGQFDNS
jgi:hypothetical protein